MFRSLWTSAAGMNSQQVNMDVVSNNLANVNTTGYKKSRAEFEDLIYATLERPEAPPEDRATPAGIQLGNGSKLSATLRDFSVGNISETNNELDVAIEGPGFFMVESPDGEELYTRDGSFNIDGEGNLVTSNGELVTSFDGFIHEEVTDISISPEGNVTGRVEGEEEELGQMTIVQFMNPAGLEAVGGNLYRETTASGFPQEGIIPGENGTGTLAQGFIENSNVNIADEMVNMIIAQRAYETNSKSIQTTDEMMSIANNIKR